jgi:hypothetical protein
VNFKPLHFIAQPVEVSYDKPPLFEKRPGCPDRFKWGERTYFVAELLSQWDDFTRRGRMAHNMRPSHAKAAARRGSWGVGRTYFRVRTENGQIFDLYYDRDPSGPGGAAGTWTLFREMEEAE